MASESILRKRRLENEAFSNDFSKDGLQDTQLIYRSSVWRYPALSCAGFTLFYAVVLCISFAADYWLPRPIRVHEAADNPGRFVAERAYKHLDRLALLGPRPAGSYANEVRAVDLLLREIGFIRQFANPVHNIDIDVQRPSGAFRTQAKDPMNSIYERVANIVVRVGAKNVTESESLLVSAHFDSVPGSPGASDNGASVAVALEVLEVVSRRPVQLKHPVIFLFNGAEENGFQAAHGFITQHKWASSVGAFINLDACGAGGREIVFQAGPGNTWLIKNYAAAAPHPFANILGQEIFEAKLIPSDTDFKVFRDYGKIPGLDLAYIRNGYVYHTKYDDITRLSLGSIQRAGDNLLSLTLQLADTEWPEQRDFEEKTIFMDYLGMFMVTLSTTSWSVFNLLLVGLSLWQTKSAVTRNKTCIPVNQLVKQILISAGCSLLSWIAAFLGAFTVVRIVSLFNVTMAWYSRPILVLGIYAAPAMCLAALVFIVLSRTQLRAIRSNTLVERLNFEGIKLLFCFLNMVTYLMNIKSNIILMMWLASAVFSRWLMDLVYRRKKIDAGWLGLYALGLTPVSLQTMYLGEILLAVLVPIAGRSGPSSNPDLLINGVTVLVSLLLFSFLMPLISLLREPRRLWTLLLTLHLVTLALVFLTPLGNPYSADVDNPRPQRVQILHVERSFFDDHNRVRSRESGYWLFAWDRHISEQTLKQVISPEAAVSVIDEQKCHELPYCGVPYYFPYLKRIRTSYWVPAPQPLVYHPARIELIAQKELGVNTRSLTFSLSGPDHMAIYLWPIKGVEVIGWSASQTPPAPDGFYVDRPLYFIYYSYGIHPEKGYNFTVAFNVPHELSGRKIVEVAVTSHILHGDEQMSSEFAAVLRKFPPTAYAYGWTATYSHWTF